MCTHTRTHYIYIYILFHITYIVSLPVYSIFLRHQILQEIERNCLNESTVVIDLFMLRGLFGCNLHDFVAMGPGWHRKVHKWFALVGHGQCHDKLSVVKEFNSANALVELCMYIQSCLLGDRDVQPRTGSLSAPAASHVSWQHLGS